MELKLDNKVAIITGGGRGIGRSIAVELAKEGAHTVIADVNYEAAKSTEEEIASLGKRALSVKADVRVKADAEHMVEMAVKTFTTLDVLVNNAGLTRLAPLVETSEESWDLVVDTNLKGAFLCSQAAAKVMIPRRKGCIVNISSMCGIQGWPERVPYGASKAGINNLTRILASELGPYGIRVNCIAPGYVLTDLLKGLINDGKLNAEELKKGTSLGRFIEPEDIAHAVAFLASEKARCITGEVLVIDGGWTSSGAAWQVFPSKLESQKKG